MPNNAAQLNGLAKSLDQLVKTIAWLPGEVKRICRIFRAVWRRHIWAASKELSVK
jgi:hypothetical protein